MVGAMVKPAEQWSIRTRAERAIESGLDHALTEVIAKLPRRLVAEPADSQRASES